MPVYIRIDWSQTEHDVYVLNEVGAAMAQYVMSHTAEGCYCWSSRARRWG